MPKPLVLILLAAVGFGAYMLGAKAGRSKYREISGALDDFWSDPKVAKVRKSAFKRLDKAAAKVAKKLS